MMVSNLNCVLSNNKLLLLFEILSTLNCDTSNSWFVLNTIPAILFKYKLLKSILLCNE